MDTPNLYSRVLHSLTGHGSSSMLWYLFIYLYTTALTVFLQCRCSKPRREQQQQQQSCDIVVLWDLRFIVIYLNLRIVDFSPSFLFVCVCMVIILFMYIIFIKARPQYNNLVYCYGKFIHFHITQDHYLRGSCWSHGN